MSRRVDVLFEFQASLWKHNNIYVLIFGYSQLFSFLISANITLISPSNIALVLFWITSSFGKQNQDWKYIWFYHAAFTGKIKYIGHSFRKMAPWSLQKHDYSSGKSCSTESCLLVFSWRISWKTFPLLLAGWGWAACRSTHNPDARLSTFTLCLFDLHIAISKNSQSHPKNAHGQLAGVFINGKHLGVLIDFKHALDPTPNASMRLLWVRKFPTKVTGFVFNICSTLIVCTMHNS